MKRLLYILPPLGILVLLAFADGWNRTAADDQSVDFRQSQIMVKLNQIEWELSRVKNRLGAQDRRFDEIERQLDRILEAIEAAGSEKSPSSSGLDSSGTSRSAPAATEPTLVGAWRLARHDFAEEIPNNIRRYLVEQADLGDQVGQAEQVEQAEQAAVRRRHTARIDERVSKVIGYFEEVVDQAGFRLIRFGSDGRYTDGTGDEGQWLVSGSRLILTNFDGRAYPGTYSVDGTELTFTITGDQVGTLMRLERESMGAGDRSMIVNTFRYTDRVRLIYTKDF